MGKPEFKATRGGGEGLGSDRHRCPGEGGMRDRRSTRSASAPKLAVSQTDAVLTGTNHTVKANFCVSG